MKPLALPLLVLSLSIAISADAATIRVPLEAPTIQAGIDLAQPGDLVLVAPNTYTGPGNRNLDFGGKEIEVQSELGPDVTIIDLQGSGRNPGTGFFFHNGESRAALVEGFTIKNGYLDAGGGIICRASSPTIRRCDFRNNHANGSGGAAQLSNTNCEFEGCSFLDNSAGQDGGAVEGSQCTAEFTDCRFEGNVADFFADGVLIGGDPIFTDCQFTNHDRAAFWGAGTLIDCRFTGNGIGAQPSNTEMIGCDFTDNSTAIWNGMLGPQGPYRADNCTFNGNMLGIGCAEDASAVITRGVFVDNDQAILMADPFFLGELTLENCTLVGNGTGVEAHPVVHADQVRLDNTIIAFGTVGRAVVPGGSFTPDLTCCDLFGNAGGDWVGEIAGQLGQNGNISADPIFCNRPLGDFTLNVDSPCSPGHSPAGCGLIGALPVGCGPTPVDAATWGAVKGRYR